MDAQRVSVLPLTDGWSVSKESRVRMCSVPSEGSPPRKHCVGDRSFLRSLVAGKGLTLRCGAAGVHCAGLWCTSGSRVCIDWARCAYTVGCQILYVVWLLWGHSGGGGGPRGGSCVAPRAAGARPRRLSSAPRTFTGSRP